MLILLANKHYSNVGQAGASRDLTDRGITV